MSMTTLTAKGQMTLPKFMRDELKLRPGDRLLCILDRGRIIIRPKTGSVKDLQHILPPPKKTVTLEEMDRAIAHMAVRRAGRGRAGR